ncbi:MAG: hypothetical protein A2563_00225 [Candidatus Magasanikbacteria bacterium RIFOXYD1_FULL_40_23]|uniref:Uncharacterized protein n=1 Tax=Candidatus Magasanikbacteria bacterium RIFOXYD1_FULL_40_23 TaxID=1798705 RepID=A0A1F6PA98_9BACT|nr:MAG: hypothetical protein A2563_00225 [Candidatus Magasanikbacteria bacterium RIFOXYD1_FULL_40_23]
MPFQNIKPITVLCQDNTKTTALSTIYSAIVCVLYHAGVLAEYNRLFNNSTGVYAFKKTGVGVKQHIAKARKQSMAGALNAAALLDFIANDTSRSSEDRYDIALITESLHWTYGSPRLVGGVGMQHQGSVVTYADLLYILQSVNGESGLTKFNLFLKMRTVHELGHVFGLWPNTAPINATDEEMAQAHCPNYCVMYWTLKEDFIEKIRTRPFCPSCLAQLKSFFIKR